jgi:hypothetical protein
MANNGNNLLIRLGIVDEKGEPNVAPLAYYFDDVSNSIYFTTGRTTKKVSSLRRRNIIGYCIDDPNPPFKGVRGKGIVKIHEDVTYNIGMAKKLMMKLTGSLDNPNAKWVLREMENGNNIILEIVPSYNVAKRSSGKILAKPRQQS